MTRSISHPYILLGLTAIFWAANATAGKLAVGHVSPMMLTFLRWTIALLIMLPFAWDRLRADWPVVRAHLWLLGVLGACGMTFFNALLYKALEYTSAIQATIVQSSMPLLVFIGMFALFRVRVLPLQFVGFMLTATGVALTASRGDLSALLGLELNLGDAMMLVAVALYAGYTVALAFKPRIHWMTMITALAIAAWLASVPLLIGEIASGQYRAPTPGGWAIAIFAAVFPSLLAQVLYIRGVEEIGANRANLFINLMPIFGAAMAVAVLGERLLPYHFAALALAVGGILLAERARSAGPPSLGRAGG